jgi:RNA polymerase sigma-70 factor (ECF subfamily)
LVAIDAGPTPLFVMNAPSRQAASTIDPQLLARVVKGDHQAFSHLYDQSSALLYSMALRILGNRDEAAELLQDVYLEVWRKVARYDVGRGTPVAWLITLTRSRAIDRLRARASRAQHVTKDATDGSMTANVADRSPGPFEAHADQELRGLVGSALASLPQAQQQAIELAYYEGLSHMEIAARLNQPLGTVKTRIKLGMSKLRETLRVYWEKGDAQ